MVSSTDPEERHKPPGGCFTLLITQNRMAFLVVQEPRGEESHGWRATKGDEKSHMLPMKFRLPALAVDLSAQAFFSLAALRSREEVKEVLPVLCLSLRASVALR